MTKKLELYKCEMCGNLVEVVLSGDGELVCCGKPMSLITSEKHDGDGEKHVPVFVEENDEMHVRVGSVPHPMTEEHHIEFIECISQDEVYLKRKYLKPGNEPLLKLKCYDLGKMTAKEFCNLHGLWEAKHD